MTIHHDFACVECWGLGTIKCSCCDNGTNCDACDGTGLDPDIIDIEAFLIAEENQRPRTPSWGLVRDGLIIGRVGGSATGVPEWTLRYEDFKHKEPKP